MSFLVCHITACMWVFITTFTSEDESSWISDLSNESNGAKYLHSMYYTITTITTVGYGDILASNTKEEIICMFIMLSGVIGFSLGTGILTTFLTEDDSMNKKLTEKIEILRRIYDQYSLPLELFDRTKKSLTFIYMDDMDELNEFMDVLPQSLKNEAALFIHEKTYKKIWFL